MNFLNFISKILFPPQCLVCTKSTASDLLCEECFRAIPVLETMRCGTCGARLPNGKKICHADTPYRLAAATNYDIPGVRTLIHKLKFRRIRKAAEPLGDLIVRHLSYLNLDFGNFTIVPLPLSRRREYERGFNQAEEIARHIAHKIGGEIAVNSDILKRTRNTKPQTETGTKKERLENVRLCFAVDNPILIRRKNILLLDDVTTSGATLREAAQTLKIAGAKTIIGLVAAKA